MDFQNRAGSKTGGGGVAGFSESNRDRKERLKKLALETIDLAKVWCALNRAQLTFMHVHVLSYSGPLLHEKPLGDLRVQTVPYAT